MLVGPDGAFTPAGAPLRLFSLPKNIKSPHKRIPTPNRPTHSSKNKQALDDVFRQGFMQGYIAEMYKAIKFDDVNVKGYFAWSFMDVRVFVLSRLPVVCAFFPTPL